MRGNQAGTSRSALILLQRCCYRFHWHSPTSWPTAKRAKPYWTMSLGVSNSGWCSCNAPNACPSRRSVIYLRCPLRNPGLESSRMPEMSRCSLASGPTSSCWLLPIWLVNSAESDQAEGKCVELSLCSVGKDPIYDTAEKSLVKVIGYRSSKSLVTSHLQKTAATVS